MTVAAAGTGRSHASCITLLPEDLLQNFD